MEFKFDFKFDEDQAEEVATKKLTKEASTEKQDELHPYTLINMTEIRESLNSIVEGNLQTLDMICTESKQLKICGVTLHFPENLEKQKSENNEFSDVLIDVNEGGAVVWECTKDLVNYLESNEDIVNGKNVLDLGCGLGILGCFALVHCKAISVDFQDYNSEVIKASTIPTLLYNYKFKDKLQTENFDSDKMWDYFCEEYSQNISKTLIEKTSMFSGSWDSMLKSCKKDFKYDIILSSETIYNVKHYPTLHGILEKCLSRNGVAYFATKGHYFGVGGGLTLWKEFIKSKNVFETEIVWTTSNANLLRFIIKIEHKK